MIMIVRWLVSFAALVLVLQPLLVGEPVTVSTGTTYYVDATSGSDYNPGTSPSQAWQTLSKINAEFASGTFSRGDRILFKRGESWSISDYSSYSDNLYLRNIGSGSGYLTIGAYDTGDRPKFDCGNNPMPAIYTDSDSTDHFIIEGFDITNASQALVWIRGSDDFILRDLEIHTTSAGNGNGSSPGIYIHTSAQNWEVHDCEIHDTGGEGLYLGKWDDASDQTGYGDVYHNRFYDTGEEGIDLKFSTQYVNVYSNHFTNTDMSGRGSADSSAIKLGGKHHTVERNVIRDQVARNAIVVAYLGAGYSIHTSDITIQNNRIDTCQWGIHLRGASSEPFNNGIIRRNEVTNCDRAFYARYTHNVIAEYNDWLNADHYGMVVEGDLPAADHNWYGTELPTDIHLSAYGGNQSFITACAFQGIECNSSRGASTKSAVYMNDPNLVSLWLLEDMRGIGHDEQRDNNYLTSYEMVGYSSDAMQGLYSAEFDLDNGGYLYIADESQKGLDTTGDLSMVAWVRPDTVDGHIMSKYAIDGDQRGYDLRLSGGAAGDVSFLASGDGIAYDIAYTPPDLVLPGFWYHTASVYNGRDLRVYVNGQLQEYGIDNPKEYSSGIYDSTAQFRIGSRDGGSSQLDGLLDAAAVFNRELSPWEIANVRENGIVDLGLLARLLDRLPLQLGN